MTSPQHVERIKLLAREKYYDNVPFHRVIAGFMAQTGDGRAATAPAVRNIPTFRPNSPMCRSNAAWSGWRARAIRTGNSQFFIMYADGAFSTASTPSSGSALRHGSGRQIKKGEPVVDPDRMIRVQVAADAKS
jgi:peptidylprolyl isomerase